jgi:nucleoid DNA-binding protein
MANRIQKAIIHPDKEFLKVFSETLFRKKYVKITGLGIFTLATTKQRVMEKHPISGERVTIPKHLRVVFKVSQTIKRKLKDYEQTK